MPSLCLKYIIADTLNDTREQLRSMIHCTSLIVPGWVFIYSPLCVFCIILSAVLGGSFCWILLLKRGRGGGVVTPRISEK